MNGERQIDSSNSSFIIPRSSFVRRRLGVLVALAMALLSLYPQFSLGWRRGGEWQGEPASMYTDEPAYAAYLTALIEGRPRRNDPFSGRDDQAHPPAATVPESALSVQFLPPYALALAARVLNFSAATIFIWLAPLAAFCASLALFRLIFLITGDEGLAAAAVPVVLCLGVLANWQGAARELLDLRQSIYFYLPFLRRYLPAAAFPFLLLFFVLVCRALTNKQRRAAVVSAVGAALALALLVFSYFYLWTAAVAWLACVTALWLAASSSSSDCHRRRRGGMVGLIVAGGGLIVALPPYLLLLSSRAANMDEVQALALTRAPDLLRRTELLGFLACGVLAWSIWRGRVLSRSPATLFAASFALLPFVLFNQQVVTGRSLQPMHYELYVANYAALVGGVITAALVWRGQSPARPFNSRLLFIIGGLAFSWGLVESKVASDRYAATNERRDAARPVARRVEQLTAQLGGGAIGHSQAERPIVLCTEFWQSDHLPTVTTRAAVLWSIFNYSFSGLTPDENRERLFRQLYYTGIDAERFAALAAHDLRFRHFLFGWARVNSRLSANWQPLTAAETEAEISRYRDFVATFDRTRAIAPLLAYVIAPTGKQTDLSKLDRWYERDAGERVGEFMLYRVWPRP